MQRSGGSWLEGIQEKSLQDPTSINKSWVWWLKPVIPGCSLDRITVQVGLGKNSRPNAENNLSQWKGGVGVGGEAQVVEHLLSKRKTLSSNPRTKDTCSKNSTDNRHWVIFHLLF
jgi:hypothetical protein